MPILNLEALAEAPFYHVYRSFEGESRMLQMSWVSLTRFAWCAQ